MPSKHSEFDGVVTNRSRLKAKAVLECIALYHENWFASRDVDTGVESYLSNIWSSQLNVKGGCCWAVAGQPNCKRIGLKSGFLYDILHVPELMRTLELGQADTRHCATGS